MIRIIDRNFNAVDIISNDSEGGINFYEDRLKTTLASGLFTFEFKTDKVIPRHHHLEVGNMVELKTRSGKQLLMTIASITEDTFYKTVYCEETTITMLNGFVDAININHSPERLSFYAKQALEGTKWEININESDTEMKLEFRSTQRRLERLREIATAFNVELDFGVEFTPGTAPKLYVNFLKKRNESKEAFRISTDDVVENLERTVNIYNMATKMLVRGAQIKFDPSKVANLKELQAKPKPIEPTKDTFAEAMIAKAFEIKKLGRRYQWGGNGNPSWDCSGYMQACIEAAGLKINHRATTYTMKQQYAPFKVIKTSELKRGDLIMYDTGYTYPGDWNHVGLYLGPSLDAPNSVIHAGDPVGLTQKANSMKIVGAVRVQR